MDTFRSVTVASKDFSVSIANYHIKNKQIRINDWKKLKKLK